MEEVHELRFRLDPNLPGQGLGSLWPRSTLLLQLRFQFVFRLLDQRQLDVRADADDAVEAGRLADEDTRLRRLHRHVRRRRQPRGLRLQKNRFPAQ